jgi:hypothetical protein
MPSKSAIFGFTFWLRHWLKSASMYIVHCTVLDVIFHSAARADSFRMLTMKISLIKIVRNSSKRVTQYIWNPIMRTCWISCSPILLVQSTVKPRAELIARTGYPELDTHFDHAVVSRTKLILIHILYRVSRIIMWAKQNSYPFLDILQVKILTVHMV